MKLGLTSLSRRDHGWYNGMIRPFVWCYNIWMFRIQAEVIAPVLQCETTVVGYNPGPKPDIVAVDEGTGIAVVVHHTEVDRTTASQMLTWTHF